MDRPGRVPPGVLKEQIEEKQNLKNRINNSNFELALVTLQNPLPPDPTSEHFGTDK